MLDDVRDHDPRPTAEETWWMAADSAKVIFRAVALAGIAIIAGVAAGVVLEQASAPPAVAAATRTGP